MKSPFIHALPRVCCAIVFASVITILTATGCGENLECETDSTSSGGSARRVASYEPPPVPGSRSGQLLSYIPGPGDSIAYDDIVWPWMMGGSGTGDWHGVRRYRVGPTIKAWRDPATWKIWKFKSEDGSVLENFQPADQKVHAIEIRIQPRKEPEAMEILEQLKYFPEVREVYIRTTLPLENHLASLRYCPYIRRLKIDGVSKQRGLRRSIGKESVKAIASLAQLRELSFISIDIDDEDLEHFEGLPHLLYLDLDHTSVTSKSFQTIATFPRIRYLKVYGNNYDQELDETTKKALESLTGRVEYLWDNWSDTVNPCTKIHASIKPLFDEIQKNGYRVRQKAKKDAGSDNE